MPGSAPERQLTPATPWRPKNVVAGLATSIGVALGALNVAGIASGLVITVMSAVSFLTAAVIAVHELVVGELKGHTRRARATFVTAIVGVAVVLIAVGVVLRPGPELPRMTGTRDVAIIGLEAATRQDQDVFDDVAASLQAGLTTGLDGEVKSYAELVDPPLIDLAAPVDQRGDLNGWVNDFLTDTDAELLVAGYEEKPTTPGEQATLRVYAFVPFAVSVDAPELTGWFPLTEYLVDRDLQGSQARDDLVANIAGHLGGLADFLNGLDAWQNGKAAEAIAAFGPMLKVTPSNPPDLLHDLALLYRGHAYETRAQIARPHDRALLLGFAQHDYEGVPAESAIAFRAQLSQAVNSYLQTASVGCGPAVDQERLRTAARSLGTVAASADPRVALKARGDQAQVIYCLGRAGATDATAELAELLPPLVSLPLPTNDPDLDVKRQVKALALSIDALGNADAERLDVGVNRISEAIDLEQGRLERQALWLSLKSVWLLRLCRIAEGQATQHRSLLQLQQAAERNRLPREKVEAYRAAFAQDLTDAEKRCPNATATPSRSSGGR